MPLFAWAAIISALTKALAAIGKAAVGAGKAAGGAVKGALGQAATQAGSLPAGSLVPSQAGSTVQAASSPLTGIAQFGSIGSGPAAGSAGGIMGSGGLPAGSMVGAVRAPTGQGGSSLMNSLQQAFDYYKAFQGMGGGQSGGGTGQSDEPAMKKSINSMMEMLSPNAMSGDPPPQDYNEYPQAPPAPFPELLGIPDTPQAIARPRQIAEQPPPWWWYLRRAS